MSKSETRAIARDIGLDIADKHDSQDICFVPSGRYSDVVERLKPEAAEAGDIVHLDGRVLGRHGGIVRYTVGQRRGLGIAAAEPLFVVALDAANRRVIVGPREALATRRVRLRDVNWIGDGPLEEADGAEVFVKVRSSRPPQAASLLRAGEETDIVLAAGEEGVAPGQACVLYDGPGAGARVLGGGVIRRAEPATRPAPAGELATTA
jgi:tRNA-specific 2-thiouridylase